MYLMSRQAVCVWAALCLAGPAYLAVARLADRRPPAPALVSMEGWEVSDVARHLAARGLKLRAVSTARRTRGSRSVVLTTTSKGWEELNHLPKAAECIDRWQGTVYCERPASPDSREAQLRLWGDCCLVAGPFVLFGDRTLLARIHDALLADGPP
jgi:hypothetical protein